MIVVIIIFALMALYYFTPSMQFMSALKSMRKLNPDWIAHSSNTYAGIRFEKKTEDGLAKGELDYHVRDSHTWGTIDFRINSTILLSKRYDSDLFGLLVPGNLRSLINTVQQILTEQNMQNPYQMRSAYQEEQRKKKTTEESLKKKYL